MAETFYDNVKKMKNGAHYVKIPINIVKGAGFHVGDHVKVMVVKNE